MCFKRCRAGEVDDGNQTPGLWPPGAVGILEWLNPQLFLQQLASRNARRKGSSLRHKSPLLVTGNLSQDLCGYLLVVPAGYGPLLYRRERLAKSTEDLGGTMAPQRLCVQAHRRVDTP